MKRKKTFFITVCFLAGLAACIDPIQLDLPDDLIPKLVIEGSVSKSGDQLEIYVLVGENTSVLERGAKVNPIPIQSAHLIYNGVPVTEVPLSNGARERYPISLFRSATPGAAEDVFQLAVELSDGSSYRSSEERLIPVPKPDSLSLVPESRMQLNSIGNLVTQSYVEVKISTPLTTEVGEKVFLRWNFQGYIRFIEAPPPEDNPFEPQNTCYYEDRIGFNNIVLYNGVETTDDHLLRFPVLDIPYSSKLSNGYYVSVYQQTLTPRAYIYWDKIRLNATSGRGLFDAVPGAVDGNISNINNDNEEVLGYFYASEVDTVRKLLRSDGFGPPSLPRSPCFSEPESSRCINCLTISGASLQKPYFWIE